MSKTDNQKIKSNFADTPKVPGAFIYSNDLDESFFSYLNDLKKIELPSGADKDDLIRQFDETMNVFREQLFSFAPAVTDFINILNDIIEGKISKEDVFFNSSIRRTGADDKFFKARRRNVLERFAELQQFYTGYTGAGIRLELLKECCAVKINYDYLELFFDRICDYLLLWDGHEAKNLKNLSRIIQNYTAEQRALLSEKFLIPDELLNLHITALFQTNSQLTKIKHEILQNHLRLVISVAQKFRNRGVPFNDIVQEGNLGLMRAVDKFDTHLGHKFSTYAVWWIKQNIIHCIAAQSRTIRIPAHMLSLISKINNTEQRLLQTLGREPESGEIAEVLELSEAKVNAVRCMARQAVSLQSPLGNNDEKFSLEDTLEDAQTAGDFTDFDRDETYKTLYRLLKTLTEREQEIITCRFGLFGHKPTPFTELSVKYNLTRERVRQLELKILDKLRTPDKLKLLDHFITENKNKV